MNLQRFKTLLGRAWQYWRINGTVALLHAVRARTRPGYRLAQSLAAPAAPAPVVPEPRPADSGWISARELVHPSEASCAPLRLYTVPPDRGGRVTMVTDSINRGHLYGGVGTALILAAQLARARGGRLRILTRNERAQPIDLDAVFEAYGIRLDHEIEFGFASIYDRSSEFDLFDDELFVTTSWWTTAATMASVRHDAILYLLQEDERMFYAFGDERLRCAQVLQSAAIRYAVNSRLLFDHLVADGLPHLAQCAHWFEPAFPRSVFHPRGRPPGAKRRLMFYARPNNLRNLFFFGIALLEAALVRNVIDLAQWDIVLVGKDIPNLRFHDGYAPERRENLSWPDYARLAGEVDLGLCLMYTPHPSYPPFDLAASGAVVVTNRYGNKQDLGGYCANILSAELQLDAMLQALAAGVQLACDDARRAAQHAACRLGSDWTEALAPVVEPYRKAA